MIDRVQDIINSGEYCWDFRRIARVFQLQDQCCALDVIGVDALDD